MIRYSFFFSSRRRHTRCGRDWSSDVCSSDLPALVAELAGAPEVPVRWNDDPAGREDRLGDEGAQRSDRLLVEELEADLQARAVARSVAVADGAAVGIRSRDGEGTREQRPVPLVGHRVVDRRD